MESTRGDVILKEFLVHKVDDGGNELLQVLASTLEGFDVGYKLATHVSFGIEVMTIVE